MDKTGGPAFPTQEDSQFRAGQGMTLRDYFAGEAILKMEIIPKLLTAAERQESCETLAAFAYQLADAMLAEREKAE